MLLYGCDNKDFIPNADAILNLWNGLKSVGANFVGTTHMTLSAVASSPDLIKKISEVNDMQHNGRWLATNLGVETVAPRMVKRHLGVKTKPYQPEEWGTVVREGTRILNDNHWFPALTLIIGWPDETPDETQYTIRSYRRLPRDEYAWPACPSSISGLLREKFDALWKSERSPVYSFLEMLAA